MKYMEKDIAYHVCDPETDRCATCVGINQAVESALKKQKKEIKKIVYKELFLFEETRDVCKENIGEERPVIQIETVTRRLEHVLKAIDKYE